MTTKVQALICANARIQVLLRLAGFKARHDHDIGGLQQTSQ